MVVRIGMPGSLDVGLDVGVGSVVGLVQDQ